MANRKKRNYFCIVVSEDVQITLKTNFSFSRESNNERFVQCNQLECQYVDLHQSPCPLHLDLFAEETEEREGKNAQVREWESKTNGSVVVRPIGT